MAWLIIGATIALLFFVAAVYLSSCLVKTPDDVVRLAICLGQPKRLQKPGLGFVWRPIEEYYDYPLSLMVMDFAKQTVHTAKGKSKKDAKKELDQNALIIDSVIHCYFAKATDAYHDKFDSLSNMWRYGIKPSRGGLVSDSAIIKEKIESFVISKQRAIASELTYEDVIFTNQMVDEMSKVLALPDSIIKDIGLVDVTYNVEYFEFVDPKMAEALYALAIASEEGEATIQRAKDQAVAQQEKFNVVNQNPMAAALDTIEKTGNHFVIPADLFKHLNY